jgi:hypothetical protein
MVQKAQENVLFTGLISHIIPNGVVILQYADDTIIFLKHDMEEVVHMKLLLYLFEMLAGLKINFNKSEIFMINDEGNLGPMYADLFNYQVGLFPIKYLGVTVSPSRLKVSDWSPLVEKCGKMLDVWKRGTMCIAGRYTLMSSSLNNSPTYHMSVYLLPKTIIHKLEKSKGDSFGKEVELEENIT